MGKYIEVTGNINKEETTEALLQHKLKNTFVLIDDKPFPGYHYHRINARGIEKKIAVFLVLSRRYPWADIIRATAKINKFLEEPIETSFSTLSLFNVPHYAIHIINIKDMTALETIQKAFQDEGFVFMKNKRMSKPKTTFFKVKRFFDITEIDNDIYLGKNAGHFLIIDKKIKWELFRKMTKSVKQNISDENFDVVNGAFYMNHTLVDFIRVFKPEASIDFLKEIKNSYQKEINKYY